MPTKPKTAPTPVATGPTKENYVEEAERCALVFVTTFATSFGVTGAFTWRDAAAAAVAAATVAVNDVLPISPLTAGIDAVLSLLGHVVPAAKTRLAVRKGARV